LSLAELGRFAEATLHESEALQLAESTHHANTMGLAHYAASWLHLYRGDWTEARVLIERGIAAFRSGNIFLNLSGAVASSAWVLAQVGEGSEALTRLREGEYLLDHHTPKGTVVSRLWRGRKRLRALLGDGVGGAGRAALPAAG